jgi:GntR family transcriptional regulator
MNSATASRDLDGLDPRRWVHLTVGLRGQITDGTLAPGAPVPSIKTLIRDYGYSRQTCGKALRRMERDGLIRRVPGLGYYVTDSRGEEESVRR